MSDPPRRRQRRTPENVRLSDVAKRAGYSTATVSRVLNNPDLVNRVAHDRINAAIQELGYLRNGVAGALRSRRTHTIGAVIPTLDHAIYARLLGALQIRCSENSYSLLVTTSEFQVDKEFQQARLLVERGAEGLVLVGHTHRKELYSLLNGKNIPYINTYTYRPDSANPSAGFDNRAASAQITRYLVDLGHRRFGLIVGFRKDNDRVKDRIDGVLSVLAEQGISVRDDRIVEEPYSIEGGRDGLRRLLGANPRPTALVCGSDVLAFGAMIECDERGIAVPGEVSIAGFDDLEFATHLKPSLTTIKVPAVEMGQKAAEHLLACLGGAPHATHYPLDTNLIVRGSTAPVAAARGKSGRQHQVA